MKRARGPHIALALIGLARIPHDLAPHHLAKAQARAQFIKESRGQAHALYNGVNGVRVERSLPQRIFGQLQAQLVPGGCQVFGADTPAFLLVDPGRDLREGGVVLLRPCRPLREDVIGHLALRHPV